MIEQLEFFSAKTLYQTETMNCPKQGTGTIIASQGKYYLVTALHCMKETDETGKEIGSPNWRNISATIYLKNDEVTLEFKQLVDIDNDYDWVILEIKRPNVKFDYEHCLALSSDYKMDEVFGSYGFPHNIDDGLYLEFSPTNERGNNWRLREMVCGGSTKSITVEKGCSGMGLFHMVNGQFHCLGIINKSVPGGDFNTMKLIQIRTMAKYFPDIYQSTQICPNKPSDEDIEKTIDKETKAAFTEASDQELAEQFLSFMELVQYADAYRAIKQLWERHPQDEWTTLNYIKTTSLAFPQELAALQEIGLALHYSTPQGVVFVARAFANNGFAQTAVEIWYINALRFNDNELDTLFYVEMLDSPMKSIVYKEYEVVTEGKCVLYDDGHEHRHCLIANDKTLMAQTMIGKNKNEEFSLNIAGEDRTVRILAIFDKYYILIHRALTDVMEQGGNRIMRPIKMTPTMTSEDFFKNLFEAMGIDTTTNVDVQLQNNYYAKPSFLLNCSTDDLLWRYYRFLFTDFKLCTWPEDLKDPERFKYVTPQTCFVLDLSSLLVLFEKTLNENYTPSRRLIVSNYLYEYIKDYKNHTGLQSSYDMHKVLEAGKIHRFSDIASTDVKLRYDTLMKWLDDYCERLSSPKVLECAKNPNETNTTLLFKHTMTLLLEDPSRALLTEDWYYLKLLNMKLFLFNCDEFLDL